MCNATAVRLLVNALATRSGGGTTVLEGLGNALANSQGVDVRFVIPRAATQSLARVLPAHALVPIPVADTLRRAWWEQARLAPLARREGDALLGLSNTLPFIRPPAGVRSAVLVQNVAPLVPATPRMYRGRGRLRLEALRRLTVRSCRSADVVFAFTRYGRDLVVACAPEARAVFVPPGGFPEQTPERPDPANPNEAASQEVSAARQGLPARSPFVLVVADLYRYKGIEDAIRALATPATRGLELLVCGASMEPDYGRALHDLAERAGVRERVRFLGSVPRARVRDLLGQALCLLQTSRVESLGLPLIEALGLGTPIVSSDIPAAHEVAGDRAAFYRPGDVGALVRLLEQVAGRPRPALDPATADALRDRFSWAGAAGRIVESLLAC